MRKAVTYCFGKFHFATLALAAAMAASACTPKEADLKIGSVGDTMAFDQATLTVKAGQTVKLTMKNNGTTEAMQHNWVLSKPGTDQETVNVSMAAGPTKDYIASDSPNILAHTKLLKPGESETITFTAPATPGEYPYFCTFPGHYPLMKGVLKVE